jgi:transposase
MSKEEAQALRELAHSRTAEARLRDRARICWLSHQGQRVAAIKAALGIADGTVRLWITRFNADGLAGLRDRQRGGRPANAHDATQLIPLVDAIRPIIGPRGKPGRPRKRPAKLHADKAYDSSALRRALRARGVTSRIARRGIDSSERLGRHRWVAERTFAWLLGFRRLGVRYERRADLIQGLLHLACTLICLKFL